MKKHNKKIIISFAFLLIVFFIIADFLLGAFFIPQSYNDFRVKNSIYHHGLQPGISTRTVWGPILYNFHTNSLGFRDFSSENLSLNKDKNEKRILLMGDSHTEGVGVDYPFTFGGLLQSYGEPRGIEFLNAAAVSYSPKIHYIKAKHLIEEENIEIDEIWAFVDISDLQNELGYEGFEADNSTFTHFQMKLNRFLKNNSFTWFTISEIKNNKEINALSETITAFNQEGLGANKNTVALYNDFFSHFDDETLLRNPEFHGVSEWIYSAEFIPLARKGIESGTQYMSKLNAVCRENDIALKISVHPWQSQVIRGDTTNLYVEAWREFCIKENIDFVNLFPVFINHENPYFITETCYITNDNHWNEIGHHRVYEYLKSNLPDQ